MSDDKNVDTPVLIKGNTLDFGTSSNDGVTSLSSISKESTKRKKSSKSEKLEKLIEDNSKQNKEFNEALNKLNDLLKNNSENLGKLSENIENNTKEAKKNSEEKEDNKKRNKKKRSAIDYFLGSDDDSELSDSEKANTLITKVAGNQKLHGVAEDTGTSALGSINPILGIIASGLDSAGINTKSVSSFLMSKYKDRKNNKKSTNSTDSANGDTDDQNKTATEIKEDDNDQKLVTSKNPSTKALAAPIESKLSDPVSNKTATEIKMEKSESSLVKEKNDEETEKKAAKELATKRHKETITELKSIDKNVKESGGSKGILGGITAALGAGGIALIGGMIFSKKFRDMVIDNVSEWFQSPINSVKSSINSFLVKLQAKLLISAERTVASIASKVTNAVSSIGKIAETAMSSISKVISPVTNLIKKSFDNIISSTGKIVKDIGGKLAQTKIGKGLDIISKTIGGIIKSAGKGLKFVGKAFKFLAKALPGVGLITGLINAYKKYKEGDYPGALLELTSGALSLIPGVGPAASIVVDTVSVARDVINSDEEGNVLTTKSGRAKSEQSKRQSGNSYTSEFSSNPTPSASEDITATPFKTKSPTTKEILGLIAQKTEEYDYDFNRVAGRISVESNFNPRAVSPVGAKGLGQFMDPTWKDWGRGKDVFDPEANIDATIRYMMYLDKRYKGDTEKADTAYNWGMGYVDQAAAQYGDGWREMAAKYGFNYKNRKTGRTEHRALPKEAYEYSVKNKNATKSFELAGGNYNNNVIPDNIKDTSKIQVAVKDDKKIQNNPESSPQLNTDKVRPIVLAQGTSPGSLVTSSSPQTATTIINQKQQTELVENMSKNQTPAPQQYASSGSSSVTINNSNFTPVNTSAYIALHQG